MGTGIFVSVQDSAWLFDEEELFSALRSAYVDLDLKEAGTRRMIASGSDGWEVELSEGRTDLSVLGSLAWELELVAWTRRWVPADVGLAVFDDQLSFGVQPLAVGTTPEQLRADYNPDTGP